MPAVPSNLRRAYYKPVATRTPVLVLLLCITLALLALTELACHQIFAHEGAGSYGNMAGIHDTQHFEGRRNLLVWTVCTYQWFHPQVKLIYVEIAQDVTPSMAPQSGLDRKSSFPLSLGAQSRVHDLLHARSITTNVGKTSQDLITGSSTNRQTLSPSEFSSILEASRAPDHTITSRDPGPNPEPTTNPTVVEPTPIVQPTPTQLVSTIVSVQTAQNKATLVNTIAATPFLPETTQVASTFVSWDSNGNPTTLVTAVATTNYVAHPTEILTTQVTLRQSLNTFSSVATVNAVPSVETYLVTSLSTTACAEATSEICTIAVISTGTRTNWIPITTGTDGKPASWSGIDTYLVTSLSTTACAEATSEICTITVISTGTRTGWIPISTGTDGKPVSWPGMGTGGGSRTISATSHNTIELEPTATVVNSSGTFFLLPDGGVAIPHQILKSEYILVAWVPLLVAALFTIPWRIVDSTIREMEPFYQLQRESGATADDSLFLDYATSNIITTPLKALSKRHYIVFMSSLLRLSVMIVAPLASETFFVSLSGSCGFEAKGKCYATWGIYTLLARVIEGLLGLMALLTILIIILGSRRTSGVFADPLSIAGLGTLIGHPQCVSRFRATDSLSSVSDLKIKLRGLKFRLMMHVEGTKQSYGIGVVGEEEEKKNDTYSDRNTSSAEVSLDEPDTPYEGGEAYFGNGSSRTNLIENHGPNGESMATPLNQPSAATRTFSTAALRRSRSNTIRQPDRYNMTMGRRDWHIIAERVLFVGAFASLAGLIIIIIYYRLNTTKNGFKRFIDSESFGLRLSLTTVGLLVNLFFGHIDEDFRRFEPYNRLIAGPSLPDDSILVPIWATPYSAVIAALRRKHLLVALIATVATFSEFLPILLANIPANSAVTMLSRVICTWLSVAILALMLVCAFCLLIRKSSQLHQLPRRPDCVGAVIRYLASGKRDGNLAQTLTKLTFVNGRQRDNAVRRRGKTYQIGWVGGGELYIEDDRFIKRSWR